MKHEQLQFRTGFRVAFDLHGAQAAEMTLARGEQQGGPDNAHAGTDQWLYVVDGHGEAVVDGRTIALQPGSLLLIECGETHRISNTGSGPLKTLSFYRPPAFGRDGEPLPAGRAEPQH